MPLFTRRTRAPTNSNNNNTLPSTTTREKHPRSQYGENNLNSRPSFGQWLKATWPDLLTQVIMGIIGLGVYEAPPAPSRSFPVYFQDGEIVYPEFAYPLRKEIVPIWAAALLAALAPIAVFLIMQIRVRSFWDVNNAVLGLLYSLISAGVFQVFLKWLIGGLRPHFLAVCKPSVSQPNLETSLAGLAQTGNGFAQIMYDRSICTGDKDEIDDSLESFPSGHTTAAFAGFVFLSLYLNAKLKLWSNYHPAYWKLIATYTPILGAVLIGGALTIDEFHNWYDIVAGAMVGTMMALSAYRMVYASVWDFRFNHIPLNRNVGFTYGGSGMGPFGGFHDAVWTRQVGWGGDGMRMGGAPFDSVVSGGLGGGGSAGPQRGANHEYGQHGRRNTVNRKPVAASGRVEHMV